MDRDFTLAVAQSPAEIEGPAARLDWLEAALGRLAAAGREIDLVLLPELFLTGYNVGARLEAWAEAADGPSARRMAALAARFGVALHYGYAERAANRLYNAAQCFGPDGAWLGDHRKLLLPPGFERDHFTPGHGCRLFTLRGFNIATLICYDAEFPETFRHLAARGADLVLVPTALAAEWGVVARQMIPTRAFENGLFVAYANHSGSEDALNYLGESCIIGPDGGELARAGAESSLEVASLDIRRVAAARLRLPYIADLSRLELPAAKPV